MLTPSAFRIPGLTSSSKKNAVLRSSTLCYCQLFRKQRQGLCRAGGAVNEVPGISGLEMNVSCPNMSRAGLSSAPIPG